jgi:saposin
MKTLDSFIGQNSTSTEIEKWLEYVCEALPSTIKDECKTFVSEYEPIIAALVSSKIPLDKVCQYVKVCPQSDDFSVELSKEMEEKINSIEMSKFEKNGPECVICEFVMSALSNYISTNSSTAEIEKWLEYVCNTAIPSTVRQECTAFVSQYGPLIIQILESQINPKQICTQIKVCSYAPASSPTYCEACEFTLAFLDYELNKDKTKEAAAKAISNVCKLAPKEYEDHCNAIVQTYGVYLIDLLDSAEPLGVCQALKLCSVKTETQKPIHFTPLVPAIQNKKTDRTKIKIVRDRKSVV